MVNIAHTGEKSMDEARENCADYTGRRQELGVRSLVKEF